MVKCESIQKFRNKQGKILGYRLKSRTGKVIDIGSSELKDMIKSDKIEVSNLCLTSDNRIVDKQPDKKTMDINETIRRARLAGIPMLLLNGSYGIENGSQLLVIIPDNVGLAPELKGLQGKNIKVIGGKGLYSTDNMFNDCKANSIDISELNTSKVTDMTKMFSGCKNLSIDLSNLDTSNVENMTAMFMYSENLDIDISNFETSKVRSMSGMFRYCKINKLDFSNFNTFNVMDMNEMFTGCNTPELDLSSFDTSNVLDFRMAFYLCKAKRINITSFVINKKARTDGMLQSFGGIIKHRGNVKKQLEEREGTI